MARREGIMHIEQEKKGSVTTLKISGDMTIYHAQELKSALLDALSDCEELEINLAEVSDMDTAGFQLLVMAKRSALAADKQLTLTAHSPVVIEVLDTYHMAAYFGDPMILSI
jgi:anti-sigma B factor antagonist